jgi:hypothetical protein
VGGDPQSRRALQKRECRLLVSCCTCNAAAVQWQGPVLLHLGECSARWPGCASEQVLRSRVL